MDTRHRKEIEAKKSAPPASAKAVRLKKFFAACDRRERDGVEPDWQEHLGLHAAKGEQRWT